LLTRDEISRELWPDGTFVDYEHGLNSAINRIREALGDTAASPRFLETLARRGYRFIAPVERVDLREDRSGKGPSAGESQSLAVSESPVHTAEDQLSFDAPSSRPRIQILATPD